MGLLMWWLQSLFMYVNIMRKVSQYGECRLGDMNHFSNCGLLDESLHQFKHRINISSPRDTPELTNGMYTGLQCVYGQLRKLSSYYIITWDIT